MTAKRTTPLLLLVLLFSTACGSATVVPTPAPTPAPATLAPKAAAPTQQPEALSAPAGSSSQACTRFADVPPLLPGAFESYPRQLEVFLDLGGNALALGQSLSALQLTLPDDPNPAFRFVDLTADGRLDVILTLHDLTRPGNPLPGVLLIYVCSNGQYDLALQQPSQPGHGTPTVLLVQDINADGLPEIVVSSLQIGAHSIFEDVHMLSWDGAGFTNRLASTTAELPFPEVQVTDYDADGVYDLEITSPGFGSVGAGPQRDRLLTWAYQPDSATWQLVADSVGASSFRIHTLHDADDALQRGETEIAILLYGLVVDDDNLQDWSDPQAERLNLGAYARLKMVVAHLIAGDPAAAENILGVMRGQYPDYYVQHVFVEMAELFTQAQPQLGTPAACQLLADYAGQHVATVLAPLGAEAARYPDAGAPFGYANQRYTADNICP